MAEAATTPRACPKDCRRCSMAQQIYCSTNLTFTSFEIMSKMLERLENIEAKMNDLQGSSDDLVNPVSIPATTDGGGDNSPSINNV